MVYWVCVGSRFERFFVVGWVGCFFVCLVYLCGEWLVLGGNLVGERVYGGSVCLLNIVILVWNDCVWDWFFGGIFEFMVDGVVGGKL